MAADHLDSFELWREACCYLSPSVAGSVKRLWRSYELFCADAGVASERFLFVQTIGTAFRVIGGLAGGICLKSDFSAFENAYPENRWIGGVPIKPRARRREAGRPTPQLGQSERLEAA